MADSTEVEIFLKVMIDKEKNRVVFAEANSDFVDILFSFLTLPMGTIVRLFSSDNSADPSEPRLNVGSFSSLYRSMKNLDEKYYSTNECKDILVNTKNSADAECRKLKINIDDTKPIEYSVCEDFSCRRRNLPSFSKWRVTGCRNCGKWLDKPVDLRATISAGNEGVFVTHTASFLISDDLHVFPNLLNSTLRILESSGTKDFGVLEEKIFNINSNQILDLLKFSVLSKTPLTDLFLGEKNFISDLDTAFPSIKLEVSADYKKIEKMVVRVVIQKSNKKILLAQTDEDFVNFLFSMLTIPLGRLVDILSPSYPTIPIVENVHKSLSNLDVGRYLKSQELKNMLQSPRLDIYYYYFCNYLKEDSPAEYYYIEYCIIGQLCITLEKILMSLGWPMGMGRFVEGPRMFMVTDDLVVTPLSSMSCITYLHSLKVHQADIEEQVIDIGMEEALNILRASLGSTNVLTNGLKHLILKKPEQQNSSN